jgi:hypothetical protein
LSDRANRFCGLTKLSLWLKDGSFQTLCWVCPAKFRDPPGFGQCTETLSLLQLGFPAEFVTSPGDLVCYDYKEDAILP